MERAKDELEEHGVECVLAYRLGDVLPAPSIRDSIDDSIGRSDAETDELLQLA